MVPIKFDGEKTSVHQNSMERAMLGVKLRDKTKIKQIKATLPKNKNIVHFANRLKWDWAGHLSRQKEFWWVSKVTFWQRRGERRLRKQKTRWSDDINKTLKHKMFHRIAADRTEWDRLREAFAQNQVSYPNLGYLDIRNQPTF